MVLTYNFYDDEFEYEIDYDEKRECFDSLSDADIITIIDEYGEDLDDFTKGEVEEAKKELDFTYLRDIAYELFEDTDEFKDMLEEWFEESAREEYRDYNNYRRDTLGYYGLSERDFC